MSVLQNFDSPIGECLLARLDSAPAETLGKIVSSPILLAVEVLMCVQNTSLWSRNAISKSRRVALTRLVHTSLGAAWWEDSPLETPQIHRRAGTWVPKGQPALVEEPSRPNGLWSSSSINGIDMWELSGRGRTADNRVSLAPSAQARVYEIRGVSDWTRLCRTYGRQNDGRLLAPRWPDVSTKWDAVHLSMGGLIALQGRDLSHLGLVSLCNWDCESTCWFSGYTID